MRKRQKFEDNADFFTIVDDNKPQNNITAPHTLTPEEVLSQNSSKPKTYNSHKALDALKKRMSGAIDTVREEADLSQKIQITNNKESDSDKNTIKESKRDTAPKTEKTTLLDKCLPYLIEEDGSETNLNKEPLYKLESVAEILKNDSERFLENLSEKYDISFDDLGNSNSNYDFISSDFKTDTEEKEVKKPEPEPQPIKEDKPQHVTAFEDKIVISDIDTPSALSQKPKNDRIHNTATITFTPVADNKGKKKLNISTFTRPIDLTGEFTNIPTSIIEENNDEVKLQENEFDEFVPTEELNDEKDGRRLLRSYSIKKRRSFIAVCIGVLVTVLLCLNWLPAIHRMVIENTSLWMCLFGGLTLIPILFNIDCFKSFKKFFSSDSSPDLSLSLATVAVTLYSAFGIMKRESITEMLIFLSVAMCFRALGEFMKASYMVTNLKIALSKTKKETVKLINDSAITYTLTDNSAEGESLIASTQPANSITDFMKYSTHGNFINGKLPFITAASVLLSVITGIVCAFYFDGAVYGFYAAAVIQCLTAIPTSFMIDNLPLYRASRKLGADGAMILGKTGAEFTEMANVAVINANKLFPNGTITLHQMQALSANNLEDTIVRAASLTECLGSTLAPIFKTIAGTGNIETLPDSDTVKYEDKMGISGWVDNRLLFIGNRTLLEAHGITVPSLEVDRKILRQGYFPVYVATEDKACALIIIQYNVRPEIAHELRKLTDSGVDLLVSSCDPNLTEEMICDYFGLYEDSVKIMNAAGRHTHRNVTSAAKTASAPAVAGRSPYGIAAVLNCASRIKKSNLLLTVFYIIAVILGTVIFAYSSFGGSGTLLTSETVLLYLLITTVISYLLYFIKRP